jgi:hypothetical protein
MAGSRSVPGISPMWDTSPGDWVRRALQWIVPSGEQGGGGESVISLLNTSGVWPALIVHIRVSALVNLRCASWYPETGVGVLSADEIPLRLFQ